MHAHKLPPIEECLQQILETREQIQQIQEALEQKPDRDEVEHWLSDVLFKLEQIHDDVLNLQNEVAEVKYQVDDLRSEDR